MKKNYLLLLLVMFFALVASAQRAVDKLNRGIVAVKIAKGVFVSWRIQSEEYYDVTYNLYRNGTKVAENLKASNYTDAAGSADNTYQVAPVVRGVEQAKSEAVSVWGNDYFEITPKHDPSLTSTYIPNDACCADVDGDGVVEILLKYTNQEEAAASFPKEGNNKEYTLFEVLKLDGTVLWWVNCGPNMGDFQNNEQNIVGYDWDLDGKAEVVMRLCEGATIHYANGSTYTIGANGKNGGAWTNYRLPKSGGVEWFTYYGNEFLLYCNGQTGEPYQCIPFPLKRYEAGETSLQSAWGDGYGHRSNKFFFGAPYLDGRKPSIFLGRGIYTRHKFAALDVNPDTHELTTRWTWTNNQGGSPWYGQGYHNYSIVDVDWDGRDEIVFGSMIIDDNGKGLSTTGLGHGDAQHHGDFNPYVHGQEGFFCNESQPANNYRDLTTGKIYHRYVDGRDDGRAIAGNFNNIWPGAMGFSAHESPISCVTGEVMPGMVKDGVGMNFNVYWDGDLCEETFNGGDNTPGYIYKYGSGGHIKELTGSLTNNSTKATPCFMGDILGDWREEFIMRTADNKLRIYTTTISTKWRNYSLWYDHQYRNGVVWQPCGYNQPPHVSYFLGELEGITQAPPSLGMTGRKEIANGGTITSTNDVITTCETNDMTVAVADGATPYIYIDNAPTWVQGSAPSEATQKSYPITTATYTHTLTGGAFAGDMRLVKQGDGILVLPDVTQLYSGATEVWAGTLAFNGKLQNSRLWLNRHSNLNSDGGNFKTIQADYGATIRPGGAEEKAGVITVADSLILNFGAICEIDIYSEGLAADQLNAGVLKIEKKIWPNGGGPAYDTPVFRINAHKAAGDETIADGKYLLGTVGAIAGNIDNIVLEGLTYQKTFLTYEDGKLYLNVRNYSSDPVSWVGDKNGIWDLDNEVNFKDDITGEASGFFAGADVTFNDDAATTNVTVKGNVVPGNITFNNTKTYTIDGDSIVGNPTLLKTGSGDLKLNNLNRIGSTVISGGTLYAASMANAIGNDCGSLGLINNTVTVSNGGAFALSSTGTSGQRIYVGQGDGGVYIPSGVTMTQVAAISANGGSTLTKSGAGTIVLNNTLGTALNVKGGTFNYANNVSYTRLVTLEGTSAIAGVGFKSTPVAVSENAIATWTLANDYYTAYSGKLTGSGTLIVVPTNTVNRVRITANWSAFTGKVRYTHTSIVMPLDNSYGLPNAILELAANSSVSNVAKSFAIGKITNGTFMQPFSTFANGNAVSGSNTWRVGNSSSELGDFTFSGKMYDDGGTNKCNFEKIGSCKMTVATSWENSGTVKVTDGELHFNAQKTLGKGALTVADGALLSGVSATVTSTAKKYPMTNSSVTVNGTLQSGTTAISTSGYIYMGSVPLKFTSTSTLLVGLNRCATATNPGCASIFGDAEKASITFADGATVKAFLTSSYNPATTVTEEKADSFRVFYDFANVSVGKVKFDLPELPEHYYWDTTKFSEGYLFVRYTSQTGVHGVTAEENVAVTVVNSSGMAVANYEACFSEARSVFATLALPRGVYVLNIRNERGKGGSIVVRK